MTTTSRPSSISSTKKSRFSFSGLTSGPKSSKRDSLFRRTPSNTDNGLGPLDSRSYLNNENYSEVSAGSSASQIRTMSRVIVKKFDKVSASTRSVISSGGSGGVKKEGYKNEEEGPDRLSSRGRNLEMILEAGMDVSTKLRAFFEKNEAVLRGDSRAGNLKMQNERILEGDWGMLTEVAVCGDNGAGKSSLINALLDVECITPISNSNSCTATPIEFRARDRAQKMNSIYTVTGTLLAQAEWLPFATGLLRDIQEDPADMRCITARGILKSLFNLSEESKVVLEDIQAIPAFFRDLAERFSTQDISEVNKHIQRLNSECWAVLKKITIYMDSPVLNTGVVLVDLPGLGKINPMKLSTVNGYLQSCESILIVSDISRVGMDDLLLDPIFEPIAPRAQLEPSSKFAFVLTQIDNIPRVVNDPKWNKKREILSRVAATRDMIHKSPKSRLNTSTVIFTSSLEYQWHHRRLLQPKMTSCISLEESGIPALRRFIQEKGLQRREAVVKSLVQGNMTTFMNSVQNWCVDEEEIVPSAPEEEVMAPEELQMCFEGMQKKIHDSIITGVSNPLRTLIRSLEQGIKNENVLRTTANEAQGIVNRWISACDHWRVLDKACRQNGSFTDKSSGKNVDWSKSIADLLIKSVNEHWESTFNQADTAVSSMFVNVSDTVLKMISEALNQTTDPDKVANELPPTAVRIYNIIHTQENLWQTNLRNTNNLVTGNQDLLEPKLGPFYNSILEINGAKMLARRKTYSSETLPELVFSHYEDVCNGVFEELNKIIKELEEKLISELDGVLDDVRSNYFHREPVEIKPRVYVDMKPVKGELMELCKSMKQLEFMAVRPRVTVEVNSKE